MRRIKKTTITPFYSLDTILSLDCQYNVIFGERSNGKTYSVLEYGIKRFWSTGEQMAIVRRWKEDFKGKRGPTMFDSLVANGVIEEMTGGEYTNVIYYRSCWYLAHKDDKDNMIKMDKPIAYAFSIGDMEHDKSTSYPNITTILFDEFLTRKNYINDEFVLFMNTVSTIVRYRDNVTIFMLGNTVNQYCPYFNEMGIRHVRDMQPGDIDCYKYGNSGLKVAVEYCGEVSNNKKSNVYFAFDNPKLQMITGGIWEVALYPHLPIKYKPKDIVFTYFISFNGDLLQCEIINCDNSIFTYIHNKTTPLKDETSDIIYSPEDSHRPNWRKRITKGRDRIDNVVLSFFKNEKVFYQDNSVGEVVRNYLLWCSTPIVKA